ncbi:MAG: hypothetical protein JXQ71_08730 [Verrucomicrobia bacterium]|nr:hypothetical protein [Verrucomicrobiota bacterium]
MRFRHYFTVLASACLMVHSASALTISDPGVAGTIEPGTENSSVANELAWANHLLGLTGTAATDSHDANGDGHDEQYKTGSTDYSGSLTGGTQIGGGSTDVSAYEWVLAKYDGQNAGYVLFNVADYGNSIPSTSETIWISNMPQQQGYALSHFTGFGSSTNVPDGGFSLGLLGLAVAGLGLLRRKLS